MERGRRHDGRIELCDLLVCPKLAMEMAFAGSSLMFFYSASVGLPTSNLSHSIVVRAIRGVGFGLRWRGQQA